jgi:DNA-binding transcriptional regulator YiaG
MAVGEQVFSGEIPARICEHCGAARHHIDDLVRFEHAVARRFLKEARPSGPGLAFARETARLQSQELARLLGVAPNSVSRWEHGRNPIDRATWATVLQLAREQLDGLSDTRESLEALGRKKATRKRIAVAV